MNHKSPEQPDTEAVILQFPKQKLPSVDSVGTGAVGEVVDLHVVHSGPNTAEAEIRASMRRHPTSRGNQ